MSRAETSVDLMVIGAGLAGLGAALFAANRGLKVCLAGDTGGLDFHTGCLDLLGVHPMQEGRRRRDPWQGLRELAEACPQHPYAKLASDTIRQAFYEFTACLAQGGLLYQGHERRNLEVLTSAGTIKQTYRVPNTMWAGARVLQERLPTLLVDFRGMKEFNLIQAVEVQRDHWPGLRHLRLTLPDYMGDLHPEAMAWDLALAENRVKLAGRIREHLGDEQAVGLPGVLGVQGTVTIKAHLEELLGVKVFEIPTPPPAVAGLRIREAMEQALAALGVQLLLKRRVAAFEVLDTGFRFLVSTGGADHTIKAKAALLAGGRFMGKGLMADRLKIWEPLFGLPVYQPRSREDWHCSDFYDPRGHAVNRAGLEVDSKFRPLAESGKPAFENLFAAGTILAHQDWMRQKCGSGLALGTALAAVESFAGTL